MSDQATMGAYLASRFFPPLPEGYVEPALAAITACEEHDLDREIILPPSLNPVPRLAVEHDEGWSISAADLAGALRLDRFVDEWRP